MSPLIAVLLAFAQDGAPVEPERPRLVVMVAVDQMVPEQLDRLEPLFTGGFARFVQQGRVYGNCALPYGSTATGPGHATYATGSLPRQHGIVGNSWVPLESAGVEYCVSDTAVLPVTSAGPVAAGDGPRRNLVSPKNLRRPTLGDRVKAALPGARVVSVSSKDRAAVTMGGQAPDLALWWDLAGAGFVTSTWYAESLPAWVAEWNGAWRERARSGAFEGGWSALPLDEHELELSGTAPDDREGEAFQDGDRTLPHALPHLSDLAEPGQVGLAARTVYGSPIADAFVVDIAMGAVRELGLGADETTDVLMISLSACDTVGHAFGPYSREVTDTLLRADRALGSLFDQLDRDVGRDRWIASLSSDHGVLDLPEALVARGIGAVRVSPRRLGAAFTAMRTALHEEYEDDFVLAVSGTIVRLSEKKILAAGLDPADVRRRAAEVLEEVGADWIQAVFTSDELGVAEPPAGGWARLWWNCFDPERSPDLRVQPRPWHILSFGTGPSYGTTHGSPYPYDRRIPLVLLGPGFEPGRSHRPVSSCAAVPTLLSVLGIEVPEHLDGRSLR